MRNAQPTEIRPSVLSALTSVLIIPANSVNTQSALFAIAALLLGGDL